MATRDDSLFELLPEVRLPSPPYFAILLLLFLRPFSPASFGGGFSQHRCT